MLRRIITFSVKNKFLVLLFVAAWMGMGIYAIQNIPIGAVPDVTNNQVQVITTTRDLPTEDVERFITYPVELEMGNLPGVKEIRSISKFGLSVVTIVFEDDMGTYLPRQLIEEKLKNTQDFIPEGFGTPFMGPISTGLGEIYQYILDVKPEYADRYTITEMRTIQDWVVKRQLTGIPGVVEVNTWGGFLKTYEVALDPFVLQSLDIDVWEVYEAISESNSITGGGYIEKGHEAYFIRSEGIIESAEEIGQIVVTTKDGHPILVKDVATVTIGRATRFGAITGNGEGEKVLGQVMMLKDANSNKVIEMVKSRVVEVQKSLPEGIFINPFLERSTLIEKTTFTIIENLLLGFLILFLIVGILLGNLRSGLIIASVIPLTLLMALSMMYWFGIDANLMSLGAIDFGIIIDGAVIIIEYISYLVIRDHWKTDGLSLDDLTIDGANKMMRSAIFGQLIIIIVFIPVLSLGGVEGKMFTPMALTFCFALISAMILCFTYIPVMASLFLHPQMRQWTFSQKLIHWLQDAYRQTLSSVLEVPRMILFVSLLLLSVAVLTYMRMGGEFVPTLDEGDVVIQPVLKTGMSLEETTRMTTRMEKILKGYPEVDQVISRIGAAEVPTDPMSMEESDIIVTLQPRKIWKTAHSKDALVDSFKTALLREIPGIEIEFTQPIEMRFNELITGVRADVAIKIFGEDLAVLYRKAREVSKLIEPIKGASDISVEKIDGLPQMSVKLKRDRLALYGLSVNQVNDVISLAFAGKNIGLVFEGERRFDMVLRYDEDQRKELSDLRNLPLRLHDGSYIPLSEVADVGLAEGPAKISRDDTRRRVVVGVNVRGRDLQSVVQDIQSVLGEKLILPSGYNIQYGGQFENLQEASNRLKWAVPMAMMLIFILLYFAFQSLAYAAIIFSAIPLAAIGGVFGLYFRGMPFSISAGVGFIALFGIAVLNGIVMIEHYKHLKKKHMDLKTLILEGSVDRLRPVLLTALAAALGFLPMAVSTSAGAEVQRPLATVVVAGLVTATLLTLLVLPVIYLAFEKKRKTPNMGGVVGILLLLLGGSAQAQMRFSEENVLDVMRANHPLFFLSDRSVEIEKKKVATLSFSEKTGMFYNYDANNLTEQGHHLHVFGLDQNVKWPGYYQEYKKWQRQNASLKEVEMNIQKMRLEKAVLKTIENIQYDQALISTWNGLVELYSNLAQKVRKKVEGGEASKEDVLYVNVKWVSARKALLNEKNTLEMDLDQLAIQVFSDTAWMMDAVLYEQRSVGDESDTLYLQWYNQNMELRRQSIDVAKAELLPEINFTVFGGWAPDEGENFYPGLGMGVQLPIFSKGLRKKSEVQLLEYEMSKMEKEGKAQEYQRRMESLKAENQRLKSELDFYHNEVVPVFDALQTVAKKKITAGDFDTLDLIKWLEEQWLSKLDYYHTLKQYNDNIIELKYLCL